MICQYLECGRLFSMIPCKFSLHSTRKYLRKRRRVYEETNKKKEFDAIWVFTI